MRVTKRIALTGGMIAGSLLSLHASGWDDPAAIGQGKALFAKNCAVCHGVEGAGKPGVDWRKRLADGTFPPPPLNGTAHTWHHSPKLLDRIITEGGKTYGKAYKGWMPAFGEKLDAAQRLAILKYLHSLWPEEIQQRYDKHFKLEE
jgi:mono/diheme cytochrome c family protein